MSIEWVTIGPCKLACGDSLEILPTLDAGSVDAVVTDPPYTQKVHAGAVSGQRGGGLVRIPKPLIPFAPLGDDVLRHVFTQLSRICRRWILATVAWQQAAKLEADPPQGLRFIRLGVWIKSNAQPQLTGDRPGQGWEAVAILHRAGERLRWNGRGRPAVWTHNIERGRYQGLHPTQKPSSLITELVQLFTNHDSVVLDPFCGSGTTAIACLQTGRSFIGIEKEPKYFDIACKRIEKAVADTALLSKSA